MAKAREAMQGQDEVEDKISNYQDALKLVGQIHMKFIDGIMKKEQYNDITQENYVKFFKPVWSKKQDHELKVSTTNDQEVSTANNQAVPIANAGSQEARIKEDINNYLGLFPN